MDRMDGNMDEWLQKETVDQETRAIVGSLVTALGGTSIERHGKYILGDDALGCMKDLRRWIKYYDEKVQRLDVKRVLAESNLVKGDLLEILSDWAQSEKKNKLKTKIALKCLEILVPLTWPLEIEDHMMKVNHHRHIPYLRLAQVEYKRAILHHDVSKILRTVIELSVPYMLMPKNERAAHDEGVIRLALILFRNVALTEQPKDLPSDGNENEVSRSATIEAFDSQGVLQMVSAIASSIGEEYVVQDVLLLELLFHLLKGVDPEKLFMEEEQLVKDTVSQFQGLVQKERSMFAGYKRYAPSRHGRFGTLVSLESGDGLRRTVSGQEIIHSTDRAISHLDKHKKWSKPKYRGKRDPDKDRASIEFNKEEVLSPSARKHLKRFVGEFLDSSFNPLFSHCRKAIEREAERVTADHSMHFFYLTGWFLKAECARRQYRRIQESRKGKEKVGVTSSATEDYGFTLVANVLNQETFVLLNRYMENTKDGKDWNELNAGMTCFTQILLTVQQMAGSEVEEDQEIAENIQNRIFHEESTHDRIIHLLKSYKDQGFGYLDSCTDLVHVFIRLIESYSKENVDLQIRSRRRQRRKRKAAQQANGEEVDHNNHDDANDLEEVQIVSRERKFEFTRFVARILTQPAVDTFIAFLKYYKDLSKEQLKRAHRFLYRVAFKSELSTFLFRVDIVKLLHQMIEGPEGLDQEASNFSEWRDLSKQLFRRLIKKLDERPELMVELLFSKIPATVFYLENGFDNVVQRAPRPPAELEVKPGMEWDQQIGVAVSVLINQNKSDALAWFKKQLAEARDERQTWQDAEEARKLQVAEDASPTAEPPADTETGSEEIPQPSTEADTPLPPSIMVKPDNDERRTAMFKDNKLRLLMKLAGFMRLGDPEDSEASWVIPSTITAAKLHETLDLIGNFEFDPPTYEDGKSAEDLLKSKAALARAAEQRVRKVAFDDDSSDDGIDHDEDLGEFGPRGPTARTSENGAPKRRRLKQRKRASDDEETDEETRARKEERAEKRRLKKMAEKQKFKSTMFIHDSDDESDEERDRQFFEQEELRRKRPAAPIAMSSEAKRGKKRKSLSPSHSDSDTPMEMAAEKIGKRAKKSLFGNDEDDVVAISSDSSSSEGEDEAETPNDEDAEMTDTPVSSQVFGDSRAEPEAPSALVKSTSIETGAKAGAADDSDEEDAFPVRSQAPRRRGGFLVDSDDDD